MKVYVVFLVFLCFSFKNYSQQLNRVDAQGRKIGAWKKSYSSGSVRFEGQFDKGKEVGVFKFYAETSTKPIIVKTFDSISTKASVVYYQENGVLESKGEMEGTERIGKWIYFYPDGKTLMLEENYEKGVLEGLFKSYFKNGKTSELLLYKNGKLHGNCKRFADNGVLIEDLNYTMGKLHGSASYFTINGKLAAKGKYENDIKVGDWQYPVKRK